MTKNEKIGIAIVIILIIIWAIGVWAGQKTNSESKKINCETTCRQVGNDDWTFPGAGPINTNNFSTKEECISACQVKIKK